MKFIPLTHVFKCSISEISSKMNVNEYYKKLAESIPDKVIEDIRYKVSIEFKGNN